MEMNTDRRTDITELKQMERAGERGMRSSAQDETESTLSDRRTNLQDQIPNEYLFAGVESKSSNTSNHLESEKRAKRKKPWCDEDLKKALGATARDRAKTLPEPEIPDPRTENRRGKSKLTPHEIAMKLLDTGEYAVMEGQLFQYDPSCGHWLLLPESDSNRALRAALSKSYFEAVSKNSLYELYEWLLQLAPKIEDTQFKQKYLLNFMDCAVNWNTGEIIPKRKHLYFRYALRLRYSTLSKMKTGAYSRFISDVFGEDGETRREFQKFLGLCLSSIRNLKYLYFLYGPSNTGKSVILNVLKALIGEDQCSSLSFTQMSNEFAITQLIGKRINLSGEVSGVSNKRLDIVKSLTGNDTVTACFKGKDHFQFRNEALLVFACNDFPPVQTVTELDSFLSRLIIFPFSNAKPREEWIDHLEDQLLADTGSIIADAIEGLQMLEADSFRLCESPAMRECKHEFIGIYDSFSLFSEECIRESIDRRVSSSRLRAAYHQYCRENDLTPLADNLWPRLLKQRYRCTPITIAQYDSLNNQTRVRGYRGIELLHQKDE